MKHRGKLPLFVWVPCSTIGAIVVIKSYSITASSNHDNGMLTIDWEFNDKNVGYSLAPDELSKVQKYITKYIMDYIT
jgi:hypothetical protein